MRVQQDDAAAELCPVWGDCRLQDLAYRYQVTGDSALATPVKYPMETANPFIVRDFSRCILCGRCIRICLEVGDAGSRELIEDNLEDEEEHLDWLEAQLDQISQMGLQNYLLAQAD